MRREGSALNGAFRLWIKAIQPSFQFTNLFIDLKMHKGHLCQLSEIQRQRLTKFASARENRRLVQKGVVVDLFDEEIRHVGARDEPACPFVRINQCAIGICLRPVEGAENRKHHHHFVGR